MTALETLQYYFTFPFVRYALVVGVLIALCASLFGVTLVLKRFSFIGDGLSHVAFGALAIASVLQLTDEMLLVLPVTVAAAILLLRGGQRARLQGDAAIAVLSVGTLAVGYLLMHLFSTSTNLSGDVCSTLFGSTSILTLTQAEVWLCVVLSAAVIALFVVFYNRIFAVTFDEAFATATGLPSGRYSLGHEPGGLAAHLGPHRVPGAVGHAAVQELPGRHPLLRRRLGDGGRRRHPDLHPGRHPGGLHHRGGGPGRVRPLRPAGRPACRKSATLQGGPISACCAGQKSFPPGIPLFDKMKR